MIIQLDPLARFDFVSFPRHQERFRPDDPPARDDHIYEPIVYHCSDCQYNVEFTIEKFSKHFHLTFSNLDGDDQIAFNEFSRINRIDIESFLDFYCPRCRKAVRVFFEGGVAGRGEFFLSLTTVLEKNNTSDATAHNKQKHDAG